MDEHRKEQKIEHTMEQESDQVMKQIDPIKERLTQLLLKYYNLKLEQYHEIGLGAGGETFFVECSNGEAESSKYIMKFPISDGINHPEEEPKICQFLLKHNIAVCVFVPNRSGQYTTCEQGQQFHLQKFIEGKTYAPNEAPEWLIKESARMLGKIHQALASYPELREGIGQDFFRYMTPENAGKSYQNSLNLANEQGFNEIVENIKYRMTILDQIQDWSFDPSKLTYCNTHGDYTVNQLICGEHQIQAVIDWTSACRHPVIWELTRSYLHLIHLKEGQDWNPRMMEESVDIYKEYLPLNGYDQDNLFRLYFYQIAVCDYYGQFLQCTDGNKEDYFRQAEFATGMLKLLEPYLL